MNEQTNRSGILEDRAERARVRLEHGLDELEQRKDRLIEAAKSLSKPPASIIVGAAVGLVATAIIVRQVRARRRRSSLRGLLESRVHQDKSFVTQGLQNAGLSLLTLLVQRLGTRGVDHFLGQGDGYPHSGFSHSGFSHSGFSHEAPLPADPRPYKAGV